MNVRHPMVFFSFSCDDIYSLIKAFIATFADICSLQFHLATDHPLEFLGSSVDWEVGRWWIEHSV